jgi:hypothetical protein
MATRDDGDRAVPPTAPTNAEPQYPDPNLSKTFAEVSEPQSRSVSITAMLII